MDHKIISYVLKLRLYSLSMVWRVVLTVIFVALFFAAPLIPGISTVIPLILIAFTWMKPTKENIKRVVRNRKYIFYRIKKFFGVYRRVRK